MVAKNLFEGLVEEVRTSVIGLDSTATLHIHAPKELGPILQEQITFFTHDLGFDVKFLLLTLGYMLANFGQYGFYLIMMISIMNTVEYNEYLHGTRDEGIVSSLRPFLTKMASALTIAIANISYLLFNIIEYTNGIASYEQAANSGDISGAEKAAAITSLLKNVQHSQTTALLLVMTVLPCALMFLSYVLYKKRYKLDEAEYDRICAELAERGA